MSNGAGLYIHVPFCRRKCVYCDFYSVTDLSLAEVYTEAAVRNIRAAEMKFDTVYFGGGTPSLLTAKQLDKMLSAADICSGAEVSMECNPNSADEKYLREIKAVGVNRLSFGVQSFDPDELRSLGRLHTAEEAESVILTAEKTGFDNISADLMLAVPNQSIDTLKLSLDKLSRLPLKHVSAYMLKVEEGTPLAENSALLGQIPDEDRTAEMYLFAVKKLAEAGFEQYEISNFAKAGYECRHNLKYWRCGEYLGIGPAAHSFIGGERFRCPKDLKKFISEPFQEHVSLGRGGDAEERAMLALRLTKEGLLLSEYPEAEKPAEALIKSGLLKKENGSLRLTPEGCLVSNEIICRLV